MNKKLLGSIVVIIGLGAGSLWSYQLNNKLPKTDHTHHHMNSEMDHSNHESQQQMNSSNMNKTVMTTMVLPEQSRMQLDKSILVYFKIQKALSKDDLSSAIENSNKIDSILMAKDDPNLTGHTKTTWEKDKTSISNTLKSIRISKNISEARVSFEKLSLNIELFILHFGGPKEQHVTKYHCPMVDNNRGASWLQNSEGTQNPYYGSQMFRCGGKVKEL